ncbi:MULTISPECIES: amidohydrolase family protein [Amycolatopsis]|uniref:amidohydrolase family protein n=1 Tax=Amycolatopsis TaxID=1813 RepID=UPI0033A25CA6
MTVHPHPIVDMSGMVLDRDCWRAYLGGFAEYAPDYFRLFGQRLAVTAGLDPRDFAAASKDPDAALDLLLASPVFDLDLDAYVARLAREGVRHQVIHSSMRPLPGVGMVSDRIAEFAARHPERLQAWASVNLADPAAAIAEVRRCVLELGMRGVSVTHFLDVAEPLSEGAHEFYRTVSELGVPLWVHTGHNLSTRVPMNWCTWREVDEIARRHPDLVVIAGHGGWPWVLEMMTLCQRHRNVYLEFSTHRPRHMTRPGSGWEPLLLHGASTVRSKILFGGIEWVHGMTTGALAAEVAALALDERTKCAWLHDNGARLLDLDPS